MGGGMVDPRAAAEPGLIYDMSLTDYIQYLCAMGYENSSLSHFIHDAQCPRTKPTILDINLPSITIPELENVTTVRRTVTNVGHPKSVYQVEVEPPLGTAVKVRPGVLVFGPGIRKLSFEIEVTATATEKTDAGYYFGSMTWRDGLHSVRIPIAVRIVTRWLFSTSP
ncbi:hypothetical protein MLD38_037231 [Melastoma candidum]|uniref:Uncharacterized protein n=1 Tax=Melastoma candidum TaxID=119954 RepID=A0ACB9LM36_9MYRT|nr:hypothetical protein MLD38_037231 [Melastoma candidum]